MFEEISQNEAGLPREVYALLAQANLLRMRGCWDDAAERCMAALRLAPNSSSAQSLLGDIYENQGRYDDAAQWYRMALDVNPNSPADRMKLERLRLRQEPREAPISEPAEAHAAENPTGISRFLHSPEAVLRYMALAAALLLVFVVGMAYVATHKRGTLASLGLVPEQEVTLQPVVVPSAAGGEPNISDMPHDPAEQALLEGLRGSQDWAAQGITIDNIQSDPRAGRVDVTFSVSAPSTGMTRALAMQAAAHVVQSAASLPPSQSATLFTARCLSASENASVAPGLIFVGDTPRSSLPAIASVLTDAQVQTLFSSVWWSPQVPA